MASVNAIEELTKLGADVDACIERLLNMKGNIMHDLFALCLEVKRKNSIEEQCNLLHKIDDAGIVRRLIETVSSLESDSMGFCTIFVSFLRRFSEDETYSQKMIDTTLHFKSSLPTPTYGILLLLDAVSWCPVNLRHQIINKQTLDYVLSSINLDSLSNDDASLIPLRTAQCRLLFILIHLEYSVKGHFIVDRMDDVTHVLHGFLDTEDHDIMKTTLRSFYKLIFVESDQLIPLHCVCKITDLLTSHKREFVTLSISALVDLLSGDDRRSTFELLEAIVELFLQCNVFKKLHIALSEFIPIINEPEARDTILQCCLFLDYCFEYVADEIAPYMIQLLLENNIMQRIMEIMTILPGMWRFKFIWKMLPHAKEQHVYFIIIYEDIISYMCNYDAYLQLIENTKRLNKEKYWRKQDTPMHVRLFMLSGFEDVLKLGAENKEWNNDRNVCLEAMIKYEAIRLITVVRDDIIEDETVVTENIGIVKDNILELCNWILKQLVAANSDDASCEIQNGIKTELIVSYFVRGYSEVSKQHVPSVVASMIGQFCLVKCDLRVPHLQLQLDVNGMVMTKQNKECEFCQNVAKNMQRCSGCKYVYYCNRLCQRKDWKLQHKHQCAKIKKLHLSIYNK